MAGDEAESVNQRRHTPPETLPTVFEKGPRATPAHHQVMGGVQQDTLIGKYRVVRHLGSGGMGAVYEAVHTEIGKTVALKLLSRDLAADPRARTRFLREALAASRLVHPHVVNVTDVGAEDDIPFLVMEMLHGEDLAACINRQPRGLPIEQAVDILLAVAAGVFAAHQAGVVHRDLKPRNIFLARNSVKTEVEPKVLDFGISKVDGGVAGNSLTESGALLGTVPYLSPEHVKGGTTDARSDQYALGVVLFESITGRYPHEGHTPYAVLQNIAEGRFFAPSAFRPDVPGALERVITRAMSTDPDARFASVHVLGSALLPFASARGQLIWGEYFGRDDDAAPSPIGASTAPLSPPQFWEPPAPLREPVSTARAARTAQFREPPAPLREPVSTARAARPQFREPPAPLREALSTSRAALPTQRRRAPGVIGWLALAAGAAAFAWTMWGTPTWQRLRDSLIAGHTTTPAAPSPPVSVARSPSGAAGAQQLPPSAAASTAVVAAAPAPPERPALPPSPQRPALLGGTPPAGFGLEPAPAAAEPVAPAPATQPPVAAAIPAAPPAPRTVSITLGSDPVGASVWLDKDLQPRGRTPLTLTLPAGKRARSVTLRLRGHLPRIVSLLPSENRTLDVALAKAAPSRQRARGPRPRRAADSNRIAEPPSTSPEWSEKLLD